MVRSVSGCPKLKGDAAATSSRHYAKGGSSDKQRVHSDLQDRVLSLSEQKQSCPAEETADAGVCESGELFNFRAGSLLN